MDGRTASVLTVALVATLVALSGCNVLAGDGPTASTAPTVTAERTDGTSDGTPDVTATFTPDGPDGTTTSTPDGPDGTPIPARTSASTAVPTPTLTATQTMGLDPLSAMDLPPGVTASAVDVETLLGDHRKRLAAASHRARYTVVRTDQTDEEVLIVDDASALSVRIDDRGTAGFLEFYADERELASRNTTADEVMSGTGPLPTREFVLSLLDSVRETPGEYVALAEWEPVGVVTADGRPRAVLEPIGLAAADEPPNGTVTDVSGRLLVTDDGRITSLTLRITVEGTNGSTAIRGIDYATDRYGTAIVERPAWVSAPPTLRPRVGDGGRLLRYEHTGGVTIPAGTQVNVTSGVARVGAATVQEPVEPGDAVYVYRTADGAEERVHVTVGERPTLPENATAFTGVVTLEGWAGDYQFQSAVDVDATTSTPT